MSGVLLVNYVHGTVDVAKNASNIVYPIQNSITTLSNVTLLGSSTPLLTIGNPSATTIIDGNVQINGSVSGGGLISNVNSFVTSNYVANAIYSMATSNYVTNYVTNAISGMATSNYVTNYVANAISGMATSNYVTNYVVNAISGMATSNYVANAISGMATSNYVTNYVANAISGMATSNYVANAISGMATSNYVTNYVANSISGMATSNYVTNYVANTAITKTGGSITGNLNISYTPPTPTGFALTIMSSNTNGGVGYADFLKVTNSYSGATSSNKSFRLNNGGIIEIINSAYSATILSLTDTGDLSVSGKISINGNQVVNGPAFSAYAAANTQTIPNNAQTKVLFQTEEYDTNNCYSSSKFTPNVAGYYQLNSMVRIDGASGTGEFTIFLYKNGVQYKRGTNNGGTQIATNLWTLLVNSIAYANGTTDYFEIYVYQSSGGSRNVTAENTVDITWFNGCMLRGV